ncbi:hypothetical protein EZS27_031253 [termite gut metagenome]|uniref:TaqI-like C-terminal specificity domain-containing protein n=1 Tax=termite gut metagenome TaxID=433724 RepID=A0A5J4QCL9_9ZZZZ
MSFGYDRLKQTGEKGARKKTNNQWFETQDTIGYWEDFYKQKIIFQEMVQEPSFMFDKEGTFFCLDTGRIIIGENIDYLISILNSRLFFFAVKKFYGGGGLGALGVRMKHTFFDRFSIPILNADRQAIFVNLVNTLINQTHNKSILIDLENEINKQVYNIYDLTPNEIESIESQ